MTPLSPALKPWLDNLNKMIAAARAADFTATPVNVRESLAGLTASLVTQHPELPWVGDEMVETGDYPVPVRIYDPAPERQKAVCLFLHGGGHMAGGVTVYDGICRKLARASGQLVVSAEYRLSPECPYPLGLRDCLNTARHLWPALARKKRNVRRQLFLAGDSGGGACAASISALAQDDPELIIDKQVLIYPCLDYTLSYPSIEENGVGYLLERSRIEWYFDRYFQHGEDRRAASPLHMPITNRLPETLMITAGYCPLRDEGIDYVEKLRDVGVPCEHRHFGGLIHAYLNLEDLVPEECVDTYREIGEFLKD